MVPAPAGLRDRRRVGARRHARARSRNRVGSRATHPLSTGGATPNAPASAVTTSFFSSSTFICCISAAAASAISALEVRSARCVGGFGGKRRAAERKIRPRLASKKTAHAEGAIVKIYRNLYSSTTTVCNSVVFESSATNRGGKPGVVSDPGDHGYRRARGVEQPAPPRARRARVQQRRRGLERRAQGALAPAHVQRRCAFAFPELLNTRGVAQTHPMRPRPAWHAGRIRRDAGRARSGTPPRWARSNVRDMR